MTMEYLFVDCSKTLATHFSSLEIWILLAMSYRIIKATLSLKVWLNWPSRVWPVFWKEHWIEILLSILRGISNSSTFPRFPKFAYIIPVIKTISLPRAKSKLNLRFLASIHPLQQYCRWSVFRLTKLLKHFLIYYRSKAFVALGLSAWRRCHSCSLVLAQSET